VRALRDFDKMTSFAISRPCFGRLVILVVAVAGLAAAAPDLERWIGAEYTPARASNQLRWWTFDEYEADVRRELAAARRHLGYTALRMFLHSSLFDADAARTANGRHRLAERAISLPPPTADAAVVAALALLPPTAPLTTRLTQSCVAANSAAAERCPRRSPQPLHAQSSVDAHSASPQKLSHIFHLGIGQHLDVLLAAAHHVLDLLVVAFADALRLAAELLARRSDDARVPGRLLHLGSAQNNAVQPENLALEARELAHAVHDDGRCGHGLKEGATWRLRGETTLVC
jgi:hypothetical protein